MDEWKLPAWAWLYEYSCSGVSQVENEWFQHSCNWVAGESMNSLIVWTTTCVILLDYIQM